MSNIREKNIFHRFISCSNLSNEIILDQLQRVKVGLITKGQRDETSKLVQLGQWLPYFPSRWRGLENPLFEKFQISATTPVLMLDPPMDPIHYSWQDFEL